MKKFIIGILLVPLMGNPLVASADEYVISGNGSGSENVINATSTTTNTVEQQNNAEINNDVSAEANTGGNEAGQNTGDVNITTGDANITSNIENSGINQSYVDNQNCCANETNLTIEGNGAGSENYLGVGSNNSTNIGISNIASINNSVNGTANTGYNKANWNGGSVNISTGNILAIDNIKNSSINNYSVKAANGASASVYISINDNGAYSASVIKFENNNDVNVNIESLANITNNSVWDLNTGKNEANGNNGDVNITTGDILLVSNIENVDINGGIVDIDCCSDDPGEVPDGTPPPSNPGSGGSSGGSSSGNSSSGASGAPAGQSVLPVTGAPSIMVLAIICGFMFFLGWYLRLRSGRAPNIA